MYKEYTQLEAMKVMGALKHGIIIISQKKGSLKSINMTKEKRNRN